MSSTSSSSSDSDTGRSSGKSWRINLQKFNKTSTKLASSLHRENGVTDLLSTYTNGAQAYSSVDPFENDDGIHPLMTALYARSDDRASQVLNGVPEAWKPLRLTQRGRDIGGTLTMEDMSAVEYDDGEGSWLPTPHQIHCEPVKSMRAIIKYYRTQRSTDIWTKDSFKRLVKKAKKWTARNRHIHGVIVDRLTSTDSRDLTDGIEEGHGVRLYTNLLHRFGHTHAEDLATLLCVLCTIQPLKKDSRTKQPETINAYFARASRIARAAKEFPAMRVPIAEPLLKVLILEGLRRHDDKKYGQTVMRAYTDDLSSTKNGQTTNHVRHCRRASKAADA